MWWEVSMKGNAKAYIFKHLRTILILLEKSFQIQKQMGQTHEEPRSSAEITCGPELGRHCVPQICREFSTSLSYNDRNSGSTGRRHPWQKHSFLTPLARLPQESIFGSIFGKERNGVEERTGQRKFNKCNWSLSSSHIWGISL